MYFPVLFNLKSLEVVEKRWFTTYQLTSKWTIISLIILGQWDSKFFVLVFSLCSLIIKLNHFPRTILLWFKMEIWLPKKLLQPKVEQVKIKYTYSSLSLFWSSSFESWFSLAFFIISFRKRLFIMSTLQKKIELYALVNLKN